MKIEKLTSANWISVSDRLPTHEDYGWYEDVIVRYRYNMPDGPTEWDVGESSHDSEYREYNNGWGFGSCDYAEVSHWMPKSILLELIED